LSRARRWPHNLLLIAAGLLGVRVLVPVSLAAVAMAGQGTGLMPQLGITGWLAGLIGFVVLDLAIYAQHVVFHRVPWLWRLHRVHHSDRALDVTTGLRFHPIEIVLSLLFKMAVVFALGIPALAVVVFEIVLNACALFNHANVSMPESLERPLRRVIVTPQMHEVHHSVVRADTDSNFGFNLAVWDRLFATGRAAPTALDGGAPVIGLPEFRGAGEERIDRMLTQPFRRDAGA
jgi:sterol desaturase/sphingolipid hydroxylase (fatty acid hydroxylase superfamily)